MIKAWTFPIPRHGGEDPGAIGNNLNEKDYNLKISQYMYDRFKELGIPVAITRNSDTTLAPNERTNNILDAFGNNEDVIVISNHLNAGGGEGKNVVNNNELYLKKLVAYII